MTAVEKALDIFGKMQFDFVYFASKETSKRNALIAVDEILESHYKLLLGVKPSIYKYWEQVKQEIEKL